MGLECGFNGTLPPRARAEICSLGERDRFSWLVATLRPCLLLSRIYGALRDSKMPCKNPLPAMLPRCLENGKGARGHHHLFEEERAQWGGRGDFPCGSASQTQN